MAANKRICKYFPVWLVPIAVAMAGGVAPFKARAGQVCDLQFHQCTAQPFLYRRVEMYQWQELQAAGRFDYRLVWSAQALDSRHYRQARAHRNGPLPLVSAWFGPHGQLHGPPRTVHESLLPPDEQRLPFNLAASFGHYRDYVQSSDDPAHPRPGDLRISWLAAAAAPVVAPTVAAAASTPTAATVATAAQVTPAVPASLPVPQMQAPPPRGRASPWLWGAMGLLLGAGLAWVFGRRR